MTADRVDAVIAAMEPHDPELAEWMRLAADALTAGEGEEVISQAGLQAFLWYQLPRKYPETSWRPVAEAAGVLLSLLGLDRYASIARSPIHREVPHDGRRSLRLGRRAGNGLREVPGRQVRLGGRAARHRAPGVGQRDGDRGGERDAVGRAGAGGGITAGELRPGTGSWRRVAAEVCGRILESPAGDGGERTLLKAIHDERADTPGSRRDTRPCCGSGVIGHGTCPRPSSGLPTSPLPSPRCAGCSKRAGRASCSRRRGTCRPRSSGRRRASSTGGRSRVSHAPRSMSTSSAPSATRPPDSTWWRSGRGASRRPAVALLRARAVAPGRDPLS